ncbi:Outer membrane protein TolC [Thiohalospira halophila DSM 15071]|uniref:Outer membrane protein TolC n=1 Tax=Thiohalospira halophila DSM 15071 TaxID=1123397 RepID=A0A1I1NCL5_9GAMM|nr:TolC family protein [Thiohalospira halophila]SFC93188.1 Outer membrane protein TolC [Thiohalospira halophila DSM 15071]
MSPFPVTSRPRQRPLAVTLVALCLASGPVSAASSNGAGDARFDPLASDAGLSLGQVVRWAADRHPEKEQSRAGQRAASALRGRADAWLSGNPAGVLSHYNDAGATAAGNREWEAGVELPLWHLGQRAARRSLAEAAEEQARSIPEAVRLQAAGRVRETLWAIALQRNRVALAETERAHARALADKVQRRLELGDLARTARLLARERVVEKETALESARSRLRVLRADYRRITGLDRTPSQWREDRARTLSDQTIPVKDHPFLRRAALKVEQLRARRRLAGIQAAEPPSLVLGTRQERAADGSAVNSLHASLRIPFGMAEQREGRRAAVGVELAAARSRLDRQRREVLTALDEARQGIAVARRTLRQARHREEFATQSRTLARKAFDAGEYGLMDLIRVQDKYAAARRDRAQRELKLERAVARFNQAAGVIPWPRSESSQ